MMKKARLGQPRPYVVFQHQSGRYPNGTEDQPRYNVTFSRLYKEGDQWKSTHSFGRSDLLVLRKVADFAHTRIFQLPQQEAEAES